MWSETNATGTTSTRETPSAASAGKWSALAGSSHFTGPTLLCQDSDQGCPGGSRARTPCTVACTSRSYGSPFLMMLTGTPWARTHAEYERKLALSAADG